MDTYEKIINDIKNKFESNAQFLAMFVTGSVARGEAEMGNDLDIVVVTRNEKIHQEFRDKHILVELGGDSLKAQLDGIEENPMKVYLYLDAKAIFDKDNNLLTLKRKAEQVLANYKPSQTEKDAIKKWLSSVIDKINVALENGDREKVSFNVSNVLWKIVEGLFTINSLPVPANTSALRRVKNLKIVSENFEETWQKILLGNLEERTKNTLALMNFILSKLS